MSSDPQQKSSWPEILANRSVVILAAVAALALVAVCILGLLLLRAWRGQTDLVAAPTPFAVEAHLPLDQPMIVGIDGTSTITVTTDLPLSVTINGRSFAVQPQVITADRVWSPTVDQPASAVWVYGTIVNYVLGLPDLADNRALLESLQPGDEIVLTTRNGVNHTFTFNSRNMVPTTNRDVFAQQTPGITLLLLGSEGVERLVVNGRYVVTEAETAGNVVSLGETAQLEDVQITVSGVAYAPNRPEAPAGFAFFQVDFEVQNVGLTALDTSRLQMALSDNLGNQYALSQVASRLGNHPPLSGFLNAGQSVPATAGYQIPAGLTAETLSWLVTRSDTNAQVQVILPFTGDARSGQGTDIVLSRAEVSGDLSSLNLGGQVTNLGAQPIVVTEADISLATEDGFVYLLLSTNPPLPWTVPPGQAVQFSLAYQRPQTPSAVFTVLNQGFQLTNLR